MLQSSIHHYCIAAGCIDHDSRLRLERVRQATTGSRGVIMTGLVQSLRPFLVNQMMS